MQLLLILHHEHPHSVFHGDVVDAVLDPAECGLRRHSILQQTKLVEQIDIMSAELYDVGASRFPSNPA